MTIYEQRHVTLSAFSVLSEVVHIAPKSADVCLFFTVKFDINTSKRTTPQQVMDDIILFVDDDSEYDPDRENMNSQSNETSLQSNKDDEDEADDEAVTLL